VSAVTLAILGDTHMPRGNRRLPDRCVELLAAAELIIHTGDFFGPEAYEEVAAIGPPLVAVAGNVDRPELAARLPETAQVDFGGRAIAVIHDAGPRNGRLRRMKRRFPDADVVVFGHSHLPLHEREDDEDPASFQIFNPGSPTERRRAPKHSMGLAEVGADGALALRHVWLD
jgi:putative phosphoesterase